MKVMMDIRIRSVIDRVLRLPLVVKLVAANTAVLVSGAVFTAWAVSGIAGGLGGPPGIERGINLDLVAWIVIASVLIGALVNTVVVRLALSPLRRLEETAMAVDGGRETARAGTSALADRDLGALMERFDDMLDSLAEARARQRAAASELVDSEERVRMRIARRLYGDVGQRLAAILLLIGRGIQGDPSDPGNDSPAVLLEIQDGIAEVLEGVRKTARSLRPPELDDLGLMAAIHAEVRTVAVRSSVPIVVRSSPPELSLEEHVGLVFFRLVQEGLSLILEETKPETVVTLQIEDAEGWAICEIEATGAAASGRAGGIPWKENGSGCTEVPADQEAPVTNRTPSFGGLLEPMRERAGWIGGTVGVDEEGAPGPTLWIRVPTQVPGSGSTVIDDSIVSYHRSRRSA